MHDFVIKMFNFVRSFLYFLRIVSVFCILMLLLYWIQNLTNDVWEWTNFIKPFLDWLLEQSDKIYSASFDFFGAVFEFKYFNALVILTIVSYILRGLSVLADFAEDGYRKTRKFCRQKEQDFINKQLHENIKREEKSLMVYSIIIKTRIKRKFNHKEIGINLDEQNKLMNNFIKEKTGISPMTFNGAFLYQFNNFDNIDNVLDVMFKLIKSSAPIDYAISIQVGSDLNQLGKLIEFEHFQQITMAADTAYRYRFNDSHRYSVSQVGLFQTGAKTLEVHEFKEIL